MNKIKQTFLNLKSFNWKLWISLCLLSLVPAIYQIIRTFLISTNTNTSGIDIISQMEWYDLIDETLKAFLIVPLYSIFNKIYSKKKNDFSKITFLFFIIVFLVYLLFNIGLLFYGHYLIKYMNPNINDISKIKVYLNLETIAFMIAIIPTFINVVFVTVGKSKNVYIFLIIQAICNIISDFVFIPKLGVNGVAISNIVTSSILAVIGLCVLRVEKFIYFSFIKKENSNILKGYFKTGLYSSLQQLIDNLIYALMVVKMVNMISNQGNYWVANNFIWSILLIPISSLAEIIKRNCQNEYTKLYQSNYYFVAILTFIIWLILSPSYIYFYKDVENIENYQSIFLITIKLIPFYLAYNISIIPDSIFIGYGKTKYNFINSLIINLIYYGIWFILYKLDLIIFSMDKIIIMFGLGMVIHSLISLIEEKLFFKKEMRYINLALKEKLVFNLKTN